MVGIVRRQQCHHDVLFGSGFELPNIVLEDRSVNLRRPTDSKPTRPRQIPVETRSDAQPEPNCCVLKKIWARVLRRRGVLCAKSTVT